ncbi:type VII secretion protein EssA [Pseudogracilibacillus sp. SE30717A]|uniref:type VII secretion protein EssA n=1 Tax=Pseudogracilibacillus sp. SE30717A TaxID=3098293 RepID=UPI00300DCDCA
MRVCQKQISILLLFSLSIFFFMPTSIFANEEGTGKGKMQIKTDRILKNPDEENEIMETELDKSFPDLFKEEVKEKIATKQLKDKEETEEIRSAIFFEEMKASTSLNDIKNELFTENYESSKAFAGEELDKETSNKVSSFVFYGSITAFLMIIGGGIVFLLRKWEM